MYKNVVLKIMGMDTTRRSRTTKTGGLGNTKLKQPPISQVKT
jgi:hypothetical protein